MSARGRGEQAVRAAFPGATVLRASVMVGGGGGLLATLQDLLARLPVLPLFGRGRTRLQPVHVSEVAEAAAAALSRDELPAPLYEFGGAEVFRYRELVQRCAAAVGRRPLLLPLPYPVWRLAAGLLRPLPHPPVTEGQVALMRRDNLPDPALPGLAALQVRAGPLQRALDELPAR